MVQLARKEAYPVRRIACVLIMIFTFSAVIHGVAGASEIVTENVEVRVRDVITLRPMYTSENTPKHEWLSSDEAIATVQSVYWFPCQDHKRKNYREHWCAVLSQLHAHAAPFTEKQAL